MAWTVAATSIAVFLGSGLVATCLTIPAAISATRTTGHFAKWPAIAILASMALPLYVQAACWESLWQFAGGWPISQTRAAASRVVGVAAVSWIQGIAATPLALIPMLVSLHRIRTSLESIAWIDRGKIGVVRSVWLPALLPASLIAGILSGSWTLREMLVTNLYRVPTWSEGIHMDVISGTAPWGSIAMSMTPMLILGAIAYWAVGWGRGHEHSSANELTPIFRVGDPLVRWIRLAAWLSVLLILAVPITALTVRAGWKVEADGAGLFSPGRLVESWGGLSDFGPELYWSFLLASGSVLISSVLAFGLLWLSGMKGTKDGWLAALNAAILSLPGPVIALALIRLSNSHPLLSWWSHRTLAFPIAANLLRVTPVLFLLLLWRWNSWRKSQHELWLVDGRSHFHHVASDFLRGSWRLLASGIVLAWWLAIGELGAYLLVLPAGVSTLSSRIFELLHYGVRYQEASLCLLLALVALVLGAIAMRNPSTSDHRQMVNDTDGA